MFDNQTPRRPVECISDLLKYDPVLRITSQQCLVHNYLRECLPENLPYMLPEPELHAQQLSIPQDSHAVNETPS
ncbi:hypothetical protein K503DRAFT_773034 [Rhizopogon vinicolor AM-OR11-026]|uniref:Protein kinase domain-containing protein n=1 Tax=Rhizopogon vinicolor AM-OR11-026 TaxID=1314800 RepID=A0A1B7MTD9_9AGAM|nr:hypothetical protein K503DRAFT_773034 [Rhizopogon vinicolor AM-OR11-026]